MTNSDPRSSAESADEAVERIMAMSEDELRAELASDGQTLEEVAKQGRMALERAKAEADMRRFIRAWLKPPAGKQRPTPWSLAFVVQQIAEQFLRDIEVEQ